MFWYNSALIKSQTLELEINDPGLLYGATIFTTLRVYENSLDSNFTNWQAHCDRLLSSIETFGWQQPDWKLVRQGAEILLAHFPILRITLFPDGREWITGRLLPQDLTEKQNNGVLCGVASSEFYRSLPSHKTGNYLSAWLARTSLDVQEAILVDGQGNWLETSTGNLWGWCDRSWYTPPIKAGILPGIVRSQLVNWLQNH
ncbi:MAG: aminotransferase class IV, partial [Nostoc sp. C3-bin3]|nr:aminotransferase class IV [Nostoc sp. C3-bin3]